MPVSTVNIPAHPGAMLTDFEPRSGRDLTSPALPIDNHGPVQVGTVLGNLYERSELSVPSGRTPLKAQLQLQDFNTMQLMRLQISRAALRMPDHPYFTICLAKGGTIRSSVNGETVVTENGQCIVASPGGPVDVEYLTNDCRGLLVRFERAFIEQELAAILGRTLPSPLRFELFPRSAALAPFLAVLRILRRDVENPTFTIHESLTERLLRLIASGLLVGAPHNYTHVLSAPSKFTGPKPIQLALDSLEADPLRFATVGDLAQLVSLSVRALEDGFRRHVGTTPLSYQRSVRLRRAHNELLEADPFETTATAIAFKWGYNNYGRFVAEYRRTYGRTPAEDLKRSHRA